MYFNLFFSSIKDFFEGLILIQSSYSSILISVRSKTPHHVTSTLSYSSQNQQNASLSYSSTASSLLPNELTFQDSGLEKGEGARFLRYSNPIFSYNYKTGNYVTKEMRKFYEYLFLTFAEVTGGIRKAP